MYCATRRYKPAHPHSICAPDTRGLRRDGYLGVTVCKRGLSGANWIEKEGAEEQFRKSFQGE